MSPQQQAKAALLLAAALWLGSCSAGGPAGQPDPGGASPPPQGAGLPPLPADSGHASSALLADGSATLKGAEFVIQLNGSLEGEALRLNAAGSETELPLAFGLYQFSGLAGGKADRLRVECSPEAGAGYYIGAADYSTGAWSWHGPCTEEVCELDLSREPGRYITPDGNFYFLVVCFDGAVALHQQSTLFYSADPGGGQLPGAPRGLSASDGLPQVVNLEWTAGAGADWYEVWRHDEGPVGSGDPTGGPPGGDDRGTSRGDGALPGGDYELVGTSAAEFWVDAGATPDTQYSYKVRAVNVAGASAFCTPDPGFCSAGDGGGHEPPPDDGCTPQDFNASDGVYTDHVSLSWTGSDFIYFVYRVDPQTGDFIQIAETAGLSYDDYDVEPGAYHIYVVGGQASPMGPICLSNEDGGYSDSAGGDPGGFRLSASDGSHSDGVELLWTPAGEGTAYDIYRKLAAADGPFELIGSTATETGYFDAEADTGEVFEYYIRAFNFDGSALDSNTDTGFSGQFQ